jgi:hypothetical protein
MAASPFQRAARQGWPQYGITGDGEWALVCRSTHTVTLYQWALLANADAARQHSNFDCVPEHRLERIKPAYAATNTIVKSPAEIEPD